MTRKKKKTPKRETKYEPDDDPILFPMPLRKREVRVRVPERSIWTENKAKLIERYLYYFVMITKHGTYIDGFAGPQSPDVPDSWSAKLVLENRPAWLRHFYLFDIDPDQIARLERLKDSHNERNIVVSPPIDFNVGICKVLDAKQITEKEATFCLIDQRTFECKWSTLQAIANYKKMGNKIELFYFFANHWLARAIAAHTKNTTEIDEWWGSGDWKALKGMNSWDRVRIFCDRLKDELGYAFVMPWAIYRREKGGNIMYFMIHASDHKEAPVQMSRAYRNAVRPKEPFEQLTIDSVL